MWAELCAPLTLEARQRWGRYLGDIERDWGADKTLQYKGMFQMLIEREMRDENERRQ